MIVAVPAWATILLVLLQAAAALVSSWQVWAAVPKYTGTSILKGRGDTVACGGHCVVGDGGLLLLLRDYR